MTALSLQNFVITDFDFSKDLKSTTKFYQIRDFFVLLCSQIEPQIKVKVVDELALTLVRNIF